MPFASVRKKIDILRQIVWRAYQLEPAMEAVFRDIFVRDLRRMGLEDRYYPLSGAANHSLLYLLLRTIREFAPRRVLEVGAGQTTLLLDAVNATMSQAMDVTTVEHDADWAEHIQSNVSHRVVVAPLAPMTIAGKSIDYYATGFLPAGARFNLVLIDGPAAHIQGAEFSRIGCLSFLPDALADDFMLIIDDAEREGEATLVAKLAERFRNDARDVHQASIAARKVQTWFCGGAFARARYF
ncbi:MAG TPA: hypothetical protein VL614_01945 [Acetobacteraceae bacterium]|jgi:hypothetical protein|nr:hypothetical protein [Acetobacteraceae bacterium]